MNDVAAPANLPARIGAVAQWTGISVDTLRFYEKQGLLKHPQRSEGGFRLYDESDVEQLRFIRSAQGMGFSLADIRELLALRDADVSCSRVRALIEEKLLVLRTKLTELRRLEDALTHASMDCDAALSGSQECERCPVLQMITQQRNSVTVRAKNYS